MPIIPAASQEHWYAASERQWQADQHRVQRLHALGHRLNQTPPQTWPKLRNTDPSLLALFRHYTLQLRSHLPQLAPEAQRHLSQHLQEMQHHGREPFAPKPHRTLAAGTQAAEPDSLHELPRRSLVRATEAGAVLLSDHARRELLERPTRGTGRGL